jgi:hypothetical protein
VIKVWKAFGVQPWRAETLKFSTDPELVAKVTDIIGMYLAPPQNAIVLLAEDRPELRNRIRWGRERGGVQSSNEAN